MDRKITINAIAITIGSLLCTSMLMASAPSPEKQRAEAFLQAYHLRLGGDAPVSVLPYELAQTIIRLALQEEFTITLVNELEPEANVKISRIIPGQAQQQCPVVWEGELSSNQYQLDNQKPTNIQITLPIDNLRIIIETFISQTYIGQTYCIVLQKEDLRALKNSGANKLVIHRLCPLMPDPRRVFVSRDNITTSQIKYILKGFAPLHNGTHRRPNQVWNKEDICSTE